ncbi:methyltransferase domain-containing protein [Pseudaminobacter arsenicus]|uniref:Methyltransferase domain-containing protein n=1 Tax=Borborobacter arsenicus TaxID=1851146 RepID=A0A432V529_9HYPH|nr:methyltransferase [Pseudaminobacter arsenicus]RUM97262.1 methyltransferase domain-containing protein [Pseudaminobacter arsenicus]
MSCAEAEPSSTIDAFHRGNFWLVQPRDAGHRAGMDALMLAAAVPSDFAGELIDFGAGAGAVGLAVASRCEGARITLVEQSPTMAEFAAKSLADPRNAHLRDRLKLLVADVTLAGRARATAGLADNSCDFVLMNPPFNAAIDRNTPDALRQEAHVMQDGLFEAWLRSAAAITRPRGGLGIIARPASLPEILVALEGRFGSAEIVPVHPRADRAAIRIVVRARCAARGGLVLRPPLILHDDGHALSARADAVSNGRASLFDD